VGFSDGTVEVWDLVRNGQGAHELSTLFYRFVIAPENSE